MRHALFVVNPAIPHFSYVTRTLLASAVRYGWGAELVLAETVNHGQRVGQRLHDYLARESREVGDGLVFAVGGDGTVRACAGWLAGTGTSLAIVPRGAGNLFALALGIPGSIEAALRVGFSGQDRAVDIATAEGQVFVAMAGAGIDAAVVGSTPHWMKHHLGWLGYAAAAVPHLARHRSHTVTIRLDSGEPFERHAQAVVVGNVGILPGNFELLGGARTNDGLLEVGVLEPGNVLGWLAIARRAVLSGAGGGGFEQFQARHVEITCGTEMPRQLDGDVIGRAASLSVAVQPSALVVRVPAGSAAE
ncbi:MAG TPA: diacylglycerol kinase family protein [Acidimicrobiales bacterium]|nr:diacylglycerol kinase family protein [Acidimicrobiales bacterium]